MSQGFSVGAPNAEVSFLLVFSSLQKLAGLSCNSLLVHDIIHLGLALYSLLCNIHVYVAQTAWHQKILHLFVIFLHDLQSEEVWNEIFPKKTAQYSKQNPRIIFSRILLEEGYS